MNIQLKKAIALLESEGLEILSYTDKSATMRIYVAEDERKRKIVVLSDKLNAIADINFQIIVIYAGFEVMINYEVK